MSEHTETEEAPPAPMFYRDLGRADVAHLAQQICRDHGEDPFKQVQESGYSTDVTVPLWWKYQSDAVNFLACQKAMSTMPTGGTAAFAQAFRLPSSETAIDDDGRPVHPDADVIEAFLKDFILKAQAAPSGSFEQMAMLCAAKDCCSWFAYGETKRFESARTIREALKGLHEAIRGRPHIRHLQNAANSLSRWLTRMVDLPSSAEMPTGDRPTGRGVK